jgi:hypothetical protein
MSQDLRSTETGMLTMMRSNSVFILSVMLGATVMLSGCTTPAPERLGDRPQTSAEQLAAHQRKQAIRARDGGYQRIYRPQPCRLTTSGCIKAAE